MRLNMKNQNTTQKITRTAVILSSILCINSLSFASEVESSKEVFQIPKTEIEGTPLNKSPFVNADWTLKLNATEIEMGKVYVLELTSAQLDKYSEVKGMIGELELPFFKTTVAADKFNAFLPIPLNFTDGTVKLEIQFKNRVNQEVAKFSVPIIIKNNQAIINQVEHLALQEEIIRPDDIKTVTKLAHEEQEMNELFVTQSEDHIWDVEKPFQFPLKKNFRNSSPFGVARYWNGNPQRRTHWGVDLAAPIGARVYPASEGRIIACKNYHFSGKTIIVDHGHGVISLYGHLSTIKVRVGDKVTRDTVIGGVGKTGKATGPTLHFQVVINRVKVDPESFVGLKL